MKHYKLTFIVIFIGLILSFGACSPNPPAEKEPAPPPTLETPATPPLTASLFIQYEGRVLDPSISPDGQYVALSWNGEQQDNFDIYLRSFGSDSLHRLTHKQEYDRGPAWSPDGQSLVFTRRTQFTCQVMHIDIATETERELGNCGRNFKADLAWSPDGKAVWFSDQLNDQKVLALFAMNVETGERQQMTHPENNRFGDTEPAFSPDGQWVAFNRTESEDARNLYVMPALGGAIRQVTHEGRLIEGHTWTPDSKGLLFSSNRTGRYNLWRMAIEPETGTASIPTLVSVNTKDLRFPEMQAGHLIIGQQTYESNLWQSPLLGASAENIVRKIIGGPSVDETPNYSPDGRYIAFASDRSGTSEIWYTNADSIHLVQLTTLEQPDTHSPRWSPNGRHIAFQSRVDGQADIHILDMETRKVRLLTQHKADDVTPTWSNDGQWVYFSSKRGDTWQIWKIASDGEGTPQLITPDGGRFAQESADATLLYYVRPDTTGLWKMPVSGGVAEQVFNQLVNVDWGNWMVRQDAIIFLERTQTGPRFRRFNFEKGKSKKAGRPMKSPPWGTISFNVSPNDLALYTQIDRLENSILMLEGFE